MLPLDEPVATVRTCSNDTLMHVTRCADADGAFGQRTKGKNKAPESSMMKKIIKIQKFKIVKLKLKEDKDMNFFIFFIFFSSKLALQEFEEIFQEQH